MSDIVNIVFESIPATIYMVIMSSVFAVVIGIILGIILGITRDNGISENKLIYKTLGFIVNILRSLPFIILMFLVYPLTSVIVGKVIGTNAAVVPLVISAAPFVTRLIEGHMMDVDKGIIEAAKSMGANKFQIIKIMLSESLPLIVNSITITIINIVSYSAMAGIVGGGGLGDIANRYGYQRNRYDILLVAVLCIIAIVEIFQISGNMLSKKINRR